jgi:hypothetical protein
MSETLIIAGLGGSLAKISGAGPRSRSHFKAPRLPAPRWSCSAYVSSICRFTNTDDDAPTASAERLIEAC